MVRHDARVRVLIVDDHAGIGRGRPCCWSGAGYAVMGEAVDGARARMAAANAPGSGPQLGPRQTSQAVPP